MGVNGECANNCMMGLAIISNASCLKGLRINGHIVGVDFYFGPETAEAGKTFG
jgi:hypothetical protein